MQAELRWLGWDRDYQEGMLGKQLRDVHALSHGPKGGSRRCSADPCWNTQRPEQSGAGHTSLEGL